MKDRTIREICRFYHSPQSHAPSSNPHTPPSPDRGLIGPVRHGRPGPLGGPSAPLRRGRRPPRKSLLGPLPDRHRRAPHYIIPIVVISSEHAGVVGWGRVGVVSPGRAGGGGLVEGGRGRGPEGAVGSEGVGLRLLVGLCLPDRFLVQKGPTEGLDDWVRACGEVLSIVCLARAILEPEIAFTKYNDELRSKGKCSLPYRALGLFHRVMLMLVGCNAALEWRGCQDSKRISLADRAEGRRRRGLERTMSEGGPLRL